MFGTLTVSLSRREFCPCNVDVENGASPVLNSIIQYSLRTVPAHPTAARNGTTAAILMKQGDEIGKSMPRTDRSDPLHLNVKIE